jgi:carboxyl-terminal processing protease
MCHTFLKLNSRPYRWIGFFFLMVLIQVACKREQLKPDYPTGSNEQINTWILDSLKRYYYWNESLPAKANIGIAPRDFFAALKNPADRFSYLVLPSDPASYTSDSKSKYGFDYSTIKEVNTGQVIGIIKLVYNDSPASRNGLKRGDYIRKINGTQISESNAATLQTELLKGNKVVLGLAEIIGGSWQDTRLVNLSTGIISDQRAISRIIESGGKKIGYLNFQSFNGGLASSLKSIFASFKSEGITDLILDLRYNSGGQVAEAAGVCAMIAPSVSYTSPFITYKGNKNGGLRTESLGAAATFDGTVSFNDLISQNLGLSRIYILSTGVTASAAEVVINNLKPYMQVVLIGERTLGKDEASFTINDMRKPKQVQWEMHPIVYKLFNAQGKGNYSAGIEADIQVNEFTALPLLPFGEAEDPLVKAALTGITNKAKMSASNRKLAEGNGSGTWTILSDTRILTARRSVAITHR